MNRESNFDIDKEIGKIGESLFESFGKENPFITNHNYHRVEDVSYNKHFQSLDIDFVVYFDEDYTEDMLLRDITDGNPAHYKNRYLNQAMAVEVKTDTRTYDTRNVVYELISHDMPGCMARSYADFIYYVCISTDLEHKETFMINMHKWRQWIRENIKDKDKVFTNSINTPQDAICNFLCKIDRMVEDKVASKIC